MKQKLFRSLVLLTGTAVCLILVLFMWLSYSYVTQETYKALRQEAKLLVAADADGILAEDLQHLPIDDRLTLVAADGTVLYDNRATATLMDNHAQRPEIVQAQLEGEGYGLRSSDTLSERSLYYALQLQNGQLLRIGRTNVAVFQQVQLLLLYGILIAVLVLAGSLLLAKNITAKVMRPLEEFDLEQPQSQEPVYPELLPIVERFGLQQDKLQKEMRRYKSKKQELKAVTNNMAEGLLFLNPCWQIESLNKSAAKFLGKEKQELLGKELTAIVQHPELRSLLQEMELQGKGRLIINSGSTYYQLNGSRIADKGYVLLLMDVTERTASEKLRREFSANVSHELKTPLQSVLGYSEIMLSGLVKPEDSKRFLQKINDEAHNLLRLIDDIIKLSRLDELKRDMLEEFSLQSVAQSAMERLRDKAAKLQVELALEDRSSGELKLLGIPSLMEEILFNLLDNGLKYNHSGGRVLLSLSETDSKLVVSVSDNGIGIPAQELTHIFERFYRIDRSRHKAIDGTGLGLSIVKHGVLFHGGTIRVLSTVGEGTEFILKFPKTRVSIQDKEENL